MEETRMKYMRIGNSNQINSYSKEKSKGVSYRKNRKPRESEGIF